ncbi:MAG: hypothetical protein CME64_01285 [Halobacteriovoraceae bacterium]|nr:hypothetical protein [Halobacteriovoraceae bacterium]|tara:strand:+ start:33212 stop:33973 length:762 start_codon:yes stop_codon:yes gene_type:complete
MKKNMNILIVEKSDEDFSAMKEALSGHMVIHAKTGTEARLKYGNQGFDFVVINMDIKGVAGLEFIKQIQEAEKRKNVRDRTSFLVTGEDAEAIQEECSQIDNLQFLPRPFTALEFKKKVASIQRTSNFKNENIRKVSEGEYLITEGGSKNQEMYWVLSGEFIITKMNKEEKNIIIGHVKQGELVGEMSFLDSLPRSASVKATEDSEVLVIPHKKFMDVLDSQPRWFRSLMTTLSHRLRDADQRIARKFVKEEN